MLHGLTHRTPIEWQHSEVHVSSKKGTGEGLSGVRGGKCPFGLESEKSGGGGHRGAILDNMLLPSL